MANKTILNTKDLIHGFGVTLYVTESCNLKCTYCYQGNCHTNKTMTFELACDILDKAIENPYFNRNVEFFGGEPTLEFELIKKVMDKYPKLLYSITSNGNFINFTPEDKEYIKRLDSLIVSIEPNNSTSKYMRKIPDLKRFIFDVVTLLRDSKTTLYFNIVVSDFILGHEVEFIDIINHIKLLRQLHQIYYVLLPNLSDKNNFKDNSEWYNFIMWFREHDEEIYKRLINYSPDVFENADIENNQFCTMEECLSFTSDGYFIPCSNYLGKEYRKVKYNEKSYTEMLDTYLQTISVVDDNRWDKCKNCMIKNKSHCPICPGAIEASVLAGKTERIEILCERVKIMYLLCKELHSSGTKPLDYIFNYDH
jgi:radical SAM domain protein